MAAQPDISVWETRSPPWKAQSAVYPNVLRCTDHRPNNTVQIPAAFTGNGIICSVFYSPKETRMGGLLKCVPLRSWKGLLRELGDIQETSVAPVK